MDVVIIKNGLGSSSQSAAAKAILDYDDAHTSLPCRVAGLSEVATIFCRGSGRGASKERLGAAKVEPIQAHLTAARRKLC